MTPISIKNGTNPAVDLQVNNPRLLNGFVNTDGNIQLLPSLLVINILATAQTALRSVFRNRIIIATDNDIYYYENGILVEVGTLIGSTYPIRMAENTQGQVGIVNGIGAWLFDQPNNTFFRLTSTLNGFDIDTPFDITSLNTFLIAIGGNKWGTSNANDGTQWDANEVIENDSNMGNLVGGATLNNNLFIFGTGGVQRWVPSIERTPSSFPFTQDPSYNDQYGLISTASLLSQNNELYYLSTNGTIRMMSPYGRNTISPPGIQRIINSYDDNTTSHGSYYFHKGQWFYQLTFSKSENAFVYSPQSKKWSESDNLILSSTRTNEVVTSNGLYNLSENYNNDNYWKIILQTAYFKPKQSDIRLRSSLNCLLLEITQGKNETQSPQHVFLQLSKDNVFFGNAVKLQLSKVAERLVQLRWRMNFVNNGFAIRFQLELKSDITITGLSAIIN